MTIREILDEIARISVMAYDNEITKSDMQTELDELWEKIHNSNC